jgi:hypothetical protein
MTENDTSEKRRNSLEALTSFQVKCLEDRFDSRLMFCLECNRTNLAMTHEPHAICCYGSVT